MCHITVYRCRPTKGGLLGHKKVARKEFLPLHPFCDLLFPTTCLSVSLFIHITFRLSSIFPVFPRPSRVSLSTDDLKRRPFCIKDALRDALTFSKTILSLSPLQLYGKICALVINNRCDQLKCHVILSDSFWRCKFSGI